MDPKNTNFTQYTCQGIYNLKRQDQEVHMTKKKQRYQNQRKNAMKRDEEQKRQTQIQRQEQRVRAENSQNNPEEKEIIKFKTTKEDIIKAYADWNFSEEIIAKCLNEYQDQDEVQEAILRYDAKQPEWKKIKRREKLIQKERQRHTQTEKQPNKKQQQNKPSKNIKQYEQKCEFQNWNLIQLRSYAEQLFQNREILMKKSSDCPYVIGRDNYIKKAYQVAQQSTLKLLAYYSKVKLVELTMTKAPPFQMDLHGYRTSEVAYILEQMFAHMKKHFHKHHQNANFAHSAHRKDYLLIVKTGVGNRSIIFGKSQLQVQINQWCSLRYKQYHANIYEDRVVIQILKM